MRHLKVLFVEDREDDALLVLREIRGAGYTVDFTRVETEEDMRAALADGDWNVIISDFSMPRFTGPEALRVLKETQRDIPFIMVSGTVGEETAVAALKAGAHDFLSKHNLNRFIPALERELREARSRRERRHAEDRLRESEAALAAVFRASPLPIVTINLDERVTSWNPAAERVLGRSAAEMIGERLPFPISQSHEIFYKRADDKVICMIVSASPLVDHSGSASGTVAIISDITEHRALEEQFRQAQKMEAVGQLAGGIAHDFNNILTAIQGYSTLVLSELPKDNEHYQDISEIFEAAQRAATLTRQLLAFSRKQVTQPELLDLNLLISNMRNLLSRVIGESYILDLDLDDDAGSIFADRGQIEQVIMNLVVNARDAMPMGGTITVSTARKLNAPESAVHGINVAPGPFAQFSIRDTGHGMSAETVAHIFEPFFTTKEVGKGTGLGLSTVYGIVVQNHGLLAVDTAPGQGTEFCVYLSEVPRSSLPESARATARGRIEQPSAGWCLVVEDDAIVRGLLKRTLQRAGYQVRTAQDADEALRVIRESGKISLVVTDMMLPGMNGADLIAAAKAAMPDIKTILISGYSSEDLALPADYAFIEKPFTPDALIATLREFYG